MSFIARAQRPKIKGHGRHSRTPSIIARPANTTSLVPSQPSIIICHEPFGVGFDIALSHSIDGDARGPEFQEHQMALAYARILRLELGHAIVDGCGALMTALLDLAASFRIHPRDRPAVKQMVDYERRGRK